MLNLGSALIKLPSERELYVLHQMARKLDMTNICWVIQGTLL